MANRRMRKSLAMLLLAAWLCPHPANAFLGDGPVNGPCVQPKQFNPTDQLIWRTGLQEKSFYSNDGSPWDSFNCFYYGMTWVLGELPPEILSNPAAINAVRANDWQNMWGRHLIPGNALFDHVWLYEHGYRRQFVATALAGGPVETPGNSYQLQGYKPGDLVVVPSEVPNPLLQSYVHVGVVTQTDGNGNIRMTRQKVNPWTCVQDLKADAFDKLYNPSEKVIYEIWRRPEKYKVGQFTLNTGIQRKPDGSLVATAQRIRVKIFDLAVDGQHIGPQDITPPGRFVAVEGFVHRSNAGDSFLVDALYGGDGRRYPFSLEVPLSSACDTVGSC